MIYLLSTSLLINIFFLINIKRISNYINIFDEPDGKRKIHKNRVPLLGGFIFLLNLFIFFIFDISFDLSEQNFFYKRNYYSFYFISTALFLTGLYDDKYDLKPNTKIFLFTFILLTSVLINENLLIEELKFKSFDKTIPLNNFSIFFTIICIIIFLNAFNMFDGINLQSGLYAFVIFSFLFLNNLMQIFSLLMLFSLLFFLFLNFKNKIFLGNSGSNLISYIISYVIIISYNNHHKFFLEDILLLMLVPGLDMLRVFFSRVKKGKNPLLADKNHIHHILINKLNNTQTNILLFFLISTPVLMSQTNLINILSAIFIGVIFYFLTLYYFTSSKT